MAAIAVVGSLNMDLTVTCERLPRQGETVWGRDFLASPGGKGANQAYAAARLGGDVAMLGRVGDDAHGATLRDNLSRAGCDVSCVKALEAASGVAAIMIDERTGANSIAVIPGANAGYSHAQWRSDAPRLADAQVVLMQLEIPIETVAASARAAKCAGALTILDPAPVQVLTDELMADIDILTPNETELSGLSGVGSELRDDNAILRACDIVQERFHGALIVKLGKRGCLVRRAHDSLFLDAIPVTPVDTIAAGDVFNAALAVSLVEGAAIESACAFAMSAAALSVTKRGAQNSAPTRTELSAFVSARLGDCRTAETRTRQ